MFCSPFSSTTSKVELEDEEEELEEEVEEEEVELGMELRMEGETMGMRGEPKRRRFSSILSWMGMREFSQALLKVLPLDPAGEAVPVVL